MNLSELSWTEINQWRQEQRKRLIPLRQSLSDNEHKQKSEAISALLEQVLKTQNAKVISVFWSIKGEPDLLPLMRRLSAQGLSLALPVVIEKDAPLEFREWTPDSIMEPGIWNIPIPVNGRKLQPTHILAPFVGFDAQGYRLGYGGGFYDRTLASLNPRPYFIGVGCSDSALESIYPQPHDVACDFIVTEKEVIEIG